MSINLLELSPSEQQEIYTVSLLNHEAKLLIEKNFTEVWVMGEISNLSQPASGHIYFSLKDENAQARCALFRLSRRRLNFTPKNGQQVLARAQVSLYEARGDFQLVVSHMQLAGRGALQVAFEKLKQKLNAEGLFDEKHKKSLPELPQCIGVITSATGAALHDILQVLKRRFASIPVIIYPSLVQGEQAAQQLVEAIATANQRQECDVLLLARGGGSLEDLWPFNEELLARAIFASKLPIITGIGHEVDFTIADFVADFRAATPSAAAEYISPDREEWRQTLSYFKKNIQQLTFSHLNKLQEQLTHLQKRLRHPGDKLREQAQHLDQLEQRLYNKIQNDISYSKQELKSAMRALDGISPLKTLERGYSIISKDHKIIRDSTEVKSGDKIQAQLHKGKLYCVIV